MENHGVFLSSSCTCHGKRRLETASCELRVPCLFVPAGRRIAAPPVEDRSKSLGEKGVRDWAATGPHSGGLWRKQPWVSCFSPRRLRKKYGEKMREAIQFNKLKNRTHHPRSVRTSPVVSSDELGGLAWFLPSPRRPPSLLITLNSTSNKCIASSNKCLTSSNKKLLEVITLNYT